MTLTGARTTANAPLEAATTRATWLARSFVVWNAVFLVVSLVELGSIADDAVVPVLLRGAVFTAAGLYLVHLVSRMRQGRRSGWFRLSLISVLAPLGVFVFIVFSPDLPLWFVAGQLGSALMLVGIAAAILQKHVRAAYPKAGDDAASVDAAA